MDRSAPMEQAMTFLCKADDVQENSVLRVVVAGYPPLAVYRLDGGFYATDDRCSHGDASLSTGIIDGGAIVCPLHFGSFDISTGQPLDPPCSREIETYALVLLGDDVMLSGPTV
jgi:nitrite reductase/ring-hydroxylating ferredoxin subunit